MRLALILLFAFVCAAKSPPKTAYSHVADISYHSQQTHVTNLLDGRTDIFRQPNYRGEDYLCTPGDEHTGPDCREESEWTVEEVDRPASLAMALDDKRTLIFVADALDGWQLSLCTPTPCGEHSGRIANIAEVIDGYRLSDEDAAFKVKYRVLDSGDVEVKLAQQ